MQVKYLPVLVTAAMVAGCGRQSLQPASTTAPVQAAAPAAAGFPDDRPAPGATAQRGPDVVIPASTRIRVRLGSTLDTRRSRAGERFSAYLDEPIVFDNRVVVPKGTEFRGHVIEARRSGRLKGRAYLGVTLDSFLLQGMTYTIATGEDVQASNSHRKRNVAVIGGGAGAGAAIGAIAGGGMGALIGAGAGAAAGTTGAFITGKKNVTLPVETPLVFSLRNSITVRG